MPPDRSAPAAAVPTSTEDLRRAYYSGPGQGWEWWVVEIDLDPAQLIVENDGDGHLYRVAYSVSAAGEITFGEAVQVAIDYVDTPAASAGARRVAASQAIGRRTPLTVYASRAESRPSSPPGRRPPVATGPVALEGNRMDPIALRASLGLGNDASEEDVVAALAAAGVTLAAPAPAPVTTDTTDPALLPPVTPAPPALPDGVSVIDNDSLAALQVAAAAGVDARNRQLADDRQRFLDGVVASGRLTRSNEPLRASLVREWDRDPAEAQRIAEGLAVVVPTTELGHATEVSASAGADDYPLEWLPARQRERVLAARAAGKDA